MISFSFVQLYCEVRAKREGTGGRQNHDLVNSLSVRSTSTGSSSLSDNSRSGSRSGTARITSLPGFGHSRNIGDGLLTCFQEDPLCEYINAGGLEEHSQRELTESSPRDTWKHLSATKTTDLGGVLHEAPGYDTDLTIGSSNSEEKDPDGLRQCSPWSELSYGSEKKRNTTALNAVRVLFIIDYSDQTSFSVLSLFPLKRSWLLYGELLWDLARLTNPSPFLCLSGPEGDSSCKQGALQLPGRDQKEEWR